MSTPSRAPTRLVDLGLAWTEQYAPEIELYHPSVVEEVQPALARLDGYLSATDLAFVLLTADPGRMGVKAGPVEAFVGHQLARVEAEFSGRLILNQESLRLLARQPRDHLTWALVGLSSAGDLLTRAEDHLPALRRWMDRGVRLIGLDRPLHAGPAGDPDWVSQALNLLVGSQDPERRLAVDLGGLDLPEREQALAWFEGPSGRSSGLAVLATRVRLSSASHPAGPGLIRLDQAARLGALGGLVGLSVLPGPETVADTVEALKNAGFGPGDPGALGLSTDFPRSLADSPSATADGLRVWARERFGPSDAAWLLGGAARAWLGRWLSGPAASGQS